MYKIYKQQILCHFILCYIDDVPSLNNPKFTNYADVMYSDELEIKDTTAVPKWGNCLDLRLEVDEDDRFYALHTTL